MFKTTKLLARIEFDHNKLSTETIEIKWPFRYFNDLRLLNFSHNLISSLSESWFLPYMLETFDLSYNTLTILNDLEFIWFIRYNMELILTHNQITNIYLHNKSENSDIVFSKEFQKELLKIDLNHNPINCDCKHLSFVQYFNKYHLKENIHFHMKELYCAEPNRLKGIQVEHLNPRELICEFEENCPLNCKCLIRSYDQSLVIDCSGKNLKIVPELPTMDNYSLQNIELNMENNHLKILPAATKQGYANVTKLLIANNLLTNLHKQQLPHNLTYLDIRGNQLETLYTDTLMFLNSSKSTEVLLSNNPWLCNCDARSLLRFTQNNIQLFKDFSNMTCSNTDQITYFYDLNDLCPIERTFYILLFLILALICLLLALYYKYENEVKIWLYAHNMCLWLVTEYELDQDKIYDAFISYSAKDEDFVLDILMPELENGHPAFKLCVHVRDWLVGECIPDQILRSIADSKKTIIVLSKHFIESVWAKMEFKIAHQAALNEGRAKVIVIIYEDIGDVEKLDDDLKGYLKMNTYLKWGDNWFWEKLRYAMPHVGKNRGTLLELSEMSNVRN